MSSWRDTVQLFGFMSLLKIKNKKSLISWSYFPKNFLQNLNTMDIDKCIIMNIFRMKLTIMLYGIVIH